MKKFKNIYPRTKLLPLILLGSLFGPTALAQSVDVNKSFNPVQIQDRAPFNVSRLSIVIDNTDPQKTLTNLNLTDNLPPGVTIAAVPNTSTSCGATVNAAPGASSLRISDGLVLSGGFCTFQVDVVSTTASVYTNTIPAGAPLANNEVVAQDASASLTVIRRDAMPPRASSKTFSPNSIISGQTSQMTITLANDNVLPLTNTNLNDNLPAGMTLASPPNASTTCAGASLNAAAGASLLGVTGATIPPGDVCTVSATVVGVTGGAVTVNLQNTINAGDLTSLNGQAGGPLANSGATTGTLAVTPVPSDALTKAFSTGSPNVGQAFTMTWTIYNNTAAAWPNLAVSDLLPAGMNVYATRPQPTTSCGGSVTTPDSSTVQLSGANLAAGRFCTVTIRVVAPTGVNGQVVTNTIPANSMTTAGSPITHGAATAAVTLVAGAPGQLPTLGSVAKQYVQLISEPALAQPPLPAGHAPATVTGGAIDMYITLNKTVPAGGINMDLTPIHLVDDWSATAPNLRFVSVVGSSCGGVVTAPAGGQTLALDNALIGQDVNSCAIRVRVRADSAMPTPPVNGTPQSNQATGCASAVTGNTPCPAGSERISNGAPALIVGNPPLFPSKSFNPGTIPLNGATRASITIQNPASTPRYNVAAVDTLPAALTFGTPLNAAVSCSNNSGPAPTYQISGKTITFQMARLDGFSTTNTVPQCTVTFAVVADTAATPGSVATNSILAGGVTATDAGGTPDPAATNLQPADANLNFSNPLTGPHVSKSFAPVTVFKENGNGVIDSNIQGTGVGELSTLTLQMVNTNATGGANFTGASMTDTLPAGVTIAFSPNITKINCGAPTISAAAGATSIAISNATVASGSSCVVTVDVIGVAKGNQVNTIPAGAVQTAQTVSNPLPASATLTVLDRTPISALFKDVQRTGAGASLQGQPVAPGDALTYVLKLSNPGYLPLSLKNDVRFVQDIVPAGVTFVSAAGGDIPGVLSGNKVLWDFSASSRILNAGEIVTLKFDVKVNTPLTAPVVNVASTSTTSSCAPYDGPACTFSPPNANCQMPADALHPTPAELANPAICHPVFVLVGGSPSLSLTKTGPANFTVGGTGEYQLTIRNGGNAATSGKLTLIEKLPPGLSLNGAISSAQGTIANLVSAGTAATGLMLNFDFMPSAALAVNGTASLTVPVAVGAAVAAGTVTNYATVGGGGDPGGRGAPPVPGPDCSDPHCANATSTVVAANALLSISKTASKQTAELGDSVTYTVTVANIGNAVVLQPNIVDRLPAGFRLMNNSSSVSGARLVQLSGAPGPGLTYALDVINPGATVTLTYRVRLGVGAMEGDGTNRVSANCPHNSNLNCANEARAKVRVSGGVFTTDACIAGMIFVDCNGNQIKDAEELGIPGVRLYLENGTYLISDVEGKYSCCGLSPKTHVLKVDQTTLPRGSRLVGSSNRNVGDANSIFLDLKKGELLRADFIEGSCSNTVLEQVKARRTLGEITAPQTEKKGGPGLKFEGKAPDYPQQGTESANQIIVKPRVNEGERHGK